MGNASDPLADFAQEHGLAYEATAQLPTEGTTLGQNGKVEGAATGAVADGVDGTLTHYSYVHTWTDSDNHTHSETRHFTVVVVRIPESIGFVPYLGFSSPGSQFDANAGGTQMEDVDLGEDKALDDCRCRAYAGTSKSWLAQLFSPTLIEWLSRSDDDFGFELANGVLCVGRNSQLGDAASLGRVWSDAGHLAEAIRRESLEETESGEAAVDAAKEVGSEDPRMEAALAKADVGSPSEIGAAQGEFSGILMRMPSTYLGGLGRAIALWLVVNLFGSALTINIFVQGTDGLKQGTVVFEAVLLLIFFAMFLRRVVRARSAKYSAEAFYRAYAADRKLTLEPPLHFAATHAEAKLPFKPERVFSGTLAGGLEGSLALTGDGSKRSDRIAMVAGPKGPFAEEELRAEAPGITAQLLDGYVQRLEEAVTAPSRA